MSGEDAITRVFHDFEDRAWQFHGPDESKPEDVSYVCFHHIVDKDPTIKELSDLPPGWCALRGKVMAPWSRELTASDTDGDEGHAHLSEADRRTDHAFRLTFAFFSPKLVHKACRPQKEKCRQAIGGVHGPDQASKGSSGLSGFV